jgi:hypothetical protein
VIGYRDVMTKPAANGEGTRGSAMRLARLSGANRRLLAETLLVLVAASFVIRLLPFRRTAELMGRETRPIDLVAPSTDKVVAACRWAVNAWADRVPWRAVCFQRGLALHMMLRRRGIGSVLHYGVAQDVEKGLHAHVWVDVAGRTVMGGEEAPRYALVASFPKD